MYHSEFAIENTIEYIKFYITEEPADPTVTTTYGVYTLDSNNELVDKIIEQGKNLQIDFKFIQNHPFEHQKYNTECGMYSLYFIIELLTENKKPDYFLKNKIPDKMMEEFRNVYFNII